MSGHSKWATTKHKKAVIDSRRAKAFAKLTKNIEVAARLGGPDPTGNPALELAISKAKKTSVPNDNIDRAVKRGSGQLGAAVEYQTIFYEGYGPQGTALLIECLTDNKNRAASEVRLAVGRNGGTMADPGSVSYLFRRKGMVSVARQQQAGELSEDDLLLAVLEAGAEEVQTQDEAFTVITEPQDLPGLRQTLDEAKLEYDNDEVGFVPSLSVQLDLADAQKFVRIYDALEDLNDVQNVYSNADMSAHVMEQLGEG